MANIVPNDRNFITDDFFGRAFRDFWQDTSFNVDVQEMANEYTVKADLPGFNKEDLQLDYDKNILTIIAKFNTNSEDRSGNYIRRERAMSTQQRQFMLKNINEDDIQATYKDGVLTIHLPKSEKADQANKRIEIQ
ncbi:heat shock protein, Hsp20 family [Melissococcus plutonius]|uniref:Heat shock protein, Hsp20 family n=1 Tax=Melissococcus plutonius (strain ATCC 35311 / DSM 29964 / CIP 104052 / LMG 20360 / NCIMB 702443) TaxID=940190 RepID=F3Y9D7_MELPT|nr:Hsp20/alpha crystallin family protein [Melissococcus plutonius]AIM25652.1 heat shock protein, Hsp20 family [Melissococcus plutonius S1]KMT24777.1 heat shock protein, Hsp20 family [Melissococcus plutonius]KMT26414.1 heat shock protein, Hsp20 family [Melissococcus plutonius]KMT27664.1 heat shock protein, Hsp20 family [Melissococcus plutonius]KMT29436.1 heat shock protein, Hsp20 family [Melissococcus plutonius]